MQVLAFSLSHCRVRELHQWRPQPQGRKKEERATAAVLRRKGSREGKNQAETKKRFDLLRARPLALHSHNGKPARRVQSARPIVEIKSSTLLQGSSEKGPRRVQARGRAIPYLAFAFFGERVVKARERERLQRKKILSTSPSPLSTTLSRKEEVPAQRVEIRKRNKEGDGTRSLPLNNRIKRLGRGRELDALLSLNLK